MRFLALGTVLSFVALVFSAQVVLEDTTAEDVQAPTEPVVATAKFPESNVFGHVVNGEKNTITITVENLSGQNISLVGVGGSVLNVQNDALIKNLTSFPLSVLLSSSRKINIPYTFNSEFKPGDIRLNIWVAHTLDGSVHHVGAYDSIVTVVEPELSIFDFKMISTYLMATGMLAGLVFGAFKVFGPKQTGRPKRKPAPVSAPVTVTATGAGGYQEEWIPEHHIRKPKAVRTKSKTAASGDEFSEMSASEISEKEGSKKTKGKGRK